MQFADALRSAAFRRFLAQQSRQAPLLLDFCEQCGPILCVESIDCSSDVLAALKLPRDATGLRGAAKAVYGQFLAQRSPGNLPLAVATGDDRRRVKEAIRDILPHTVQRVRVAAEGGICRGRSDSGEADAGAGAGAAHEFVFHVGLLAALREIESRCRAVLEFSLFPKFVSLRSAAGSNSGSGSASSSFSVDSARWRVGQTSPLVECPPQLDVGVHTEAERDELAIVSGATTVAVSHAASKAGSHEVESVHEKLAGFKSMMQMNSVRRTYSKVSVDSCRAAAIASITALSALQLDGQDNSDISGLCAMLERVRDATTSVAERPSLTPSDRIVEDLLIPLCDFQQLVQPSSEQQVDLERSLATPRVRSNLESIGFRIASRLDAFIEHIRLIGEAGELVARASTLRLDIIVDQEGQEFWSRYFGLDCLYAPWNEFIQALGSELAASGGLEQDAKLAADSRTKGLLEAEYATLDKLSGFDERPSFEHRDGDEAETLRFLLDRAGTNHVSQYKFSEFLKAFGPLRGGESRELASRLGSELQDNCITRVKLLVREKFFYGLVSKREAELLLSNCASGTFLLRFSKSRTGSFAIAVRGRSPGVIHHILIASVRPLGFRVYDTEVGAERIFSTIASLVQAFPRLLKVSLDCQLPFEPYFQGDMPANEAEIAACSLSVPGAYLIRFIDDPTSGDVEHAEPAVLNVILTSAQDERSANNFPARISLTDGKAWLLQSAETAQLPQHLVGVKFHSVRYLLASLQQSHVISQVYVRSAHADVMSIFYRWRLELSDVENQISNAFESILSR